MTAQVNKSHSNPFLVFEKEARGKSPPDIYLQDLVLNLYRGHGNVYLRALLQDYSQFYRELTLSMLAWYTKHGEGCPQFMRIARAVERDSYFF